MALVKCVECKREISSKAKICPHCGRKDPTFSFINRLKRLLILMISFVVIVFFLSAISGNPPKNKTSIKKTEIKQKTKPKKSIKFLSKEERVLYGKVKKIPAAEVEKNRDGYQELLELNPGSAFYKRKLKYYSTLLHNKEIERVKREHDEEVEREQRRRAEEIIGTLVQSDAISIDNVNYRIYVNPEFWGMMDYDKKEVFCRVLQSIYPLHSILDKYSGKKLADRNLFGETRILHWIGHNDFILT